MSERQIKEYYERIEKLLNGANKETYGFAPQEIKNILRSYEELQNQNQELKEKIDGVYEERTYLYNKLSMENKQLISKLDKYDAIVDERDELKKQLRTSAIFNEEDIRLDQTKEVFETLANILNTESCSYRYLIYDLLGFKEENYIDLIAGMSITNAIVELEELENQQKEFIEFLEDKIKFSTKPTTCILLKSILQNYKKIIGDDK